MPDCSNMCHESSGMGLSETIGIGKGTVSLQDFDEAEAIFVIGQNPGTNHQDAFGSRRVKEKRGDDRSVNPLRERGLERFAHPQKPLALLGRSTALSDRYLQVRINGDVAFLKGVMKRVLAREADAPGTIIDHAFIEQHTRGYEAFCDALHAVDWDEIVRESGLSRAEIEAAGDIYCDAKSTIICWAMGLTQHKNGVATFRKWSTSVVAWQSRPAQCGCLSGSRT